MAQKVLLVAHTGRADAVQAAHDVSTQLQAAGVEVLWPEMSLNLADVDLVIVLGGDGTILRAAELVRGYSIPLLGVNLGHVGFLAESERADLSHTVECVVRREYTVEERMTIDVTVWLDGAKVAHNWALNEVSVEKSERERVLEAVIEVDGRPLSTFGCDGVVMATPTGSTAYAFSASGPVVWPGVEALLMVPISAHALFSRPLVVSPDSRLAVEVLSRTPTEGVMWCDGRRSWRLPPGSRVEVTRSKTPVQLARVHQAPFADRLVQKFALPVHGWRGPLAGDTAGSPESIHTSPIPQVTPKHRGDPQPPPEQDSRQGPGEPQP